MARILIVEDEEKIARFVTLELEHEGYQVEHAADGRTAVDLALERNYDLILLDVLLPQLNGMEVLRRVRKHKDVPVIMVTARDAVMDKVAGLDAGADDYLTKPFDLAELLARLRALVRRAAGEARPTLAHGGVVLDPASKHVTFNGQSVTLSAREYALLDDLLRHKNHIRTRAQLEESIYAWGEETGSNTVEVFVHHLRKKFGADFIRTVRGLGYQLGDSN